MRHSTESRWAVLFISLFLITCGTLNAQDSEDADPIDSESCIDCHDTDEHGVLIDEQLTESVHGFMECQDCHTNRLVYPHPEPTGLVIGYLGCGSCHEDALEDYQVHGSTAIGESEDIPTCATCHGSHKVLPSDANDSMTNPANLPKTCGDCHENPEITGRWEMLISRPIKMFEGSIHSEAARGGVFIAASCNDCHSSGGSAHKILSPGNPASTTNHFNIPSTCGVCHRGIENLYWEGIHGKLAARGETDSPVCTDCHGEHTIGSTHNPLSMTSHNKMAHDVCSPCHESPILNEKYGLPKGRYATFIDSYHGLKSKTGDERVANCGSCHRVHATLPHTYPASSVHPNNLEATCGKCHEGMTPELARTPIHGVTSPQGMRTPTADVIAQIYIFAIFIIIGLMALHWIIDLARQIRLTINRKPQVKRMTGNEVWQHHLLAISFIVLVITGFSLRYNEFLITEFFFGRDGGGELRGIIHRVAAVLNIIGILWHMLYLLTPRGKQFLVDMFPRWKDFKEFGQRISYSLGYTSTTPQFGRFSYVEKAEYWALVWGSVVMVITGFLLWFDNWFIQFLPNGTLDVALVFHFYEAWLAFLSIIIWHGYSTVFNPHVYPMNPSWITGRMPEEMYAHEHPAHLREIKMEEERSMRKQMKDMATVHTPEEIAKGARDEVEQKGDSNASEDNRD